MLILKVSGLLTVFTVSCVLGFLKSSALNKRAGKLLDFLKGMDFLGERIKMGNCEIAELLKISFKDYLIIYNENGFFADGDYLKKEDIAPINEFLSKLGMSDTDSEYERIKAYKAIIELQHKTAESDCLNLCKLYKTLGVLTGVFICIFLL